MNGVAYDPDGRTLLVAAGTTVQLWDLRATGPETSIVNPVVLDGHTGA